MQNPQQRCVLLSHTITSWLVVWVLVFNAFYCVIPAHAHAIIDQPQPHATQLTHTHEHLADILAWLGVVTIVVLTLLPQTVTASGSPPHRGLRIAPLKPPPQPAHSQSYIGQHAVFPFHHHE